MSPAVPRDFPAALGPLGSPRLLGSPETVELTVSPGPAGLPVPSLPPSPLGTPWLTCHARYKGHGTCVFIGCPRDSSTVCPSPLPVRWERLNPPYRTQPCSATCSSASAERLHSHTLVLPHDWFPPTIGFHGGCRLSGNRRSLQKLYAFAWYVTPMSLHRHTHVVWSL